MSHAFTTSDGMRISYEIDDYTDPWRKADTLVMVHSAMASARRYYAMVPALARHFRVVRMDMRGHGKSQVPPPDSPLSMERLVADLVELIAHLELPAVHLLGNSAGGYVCQNTAIAHPDRVKSLVLFGSGPGLKGTDATGWVERIGAEGLRAFLARTIGYRFGAEVDPGIVNFFLDEVEKNDVPWLARFVGLMSSLNWADRLHLIRCPTFLIIPGQDTASGVRDYSPMTDNIPDIRSVTLDGVCHNACDSVPDRCAEAALGFLLERFPENKARAA